jgi:hypothetical protein
METRLKQTLLYDSPDTSIALLAMLLDYTIQNEDRGDAYGDSKKINHALEGRYAISQSLRGQKILAHAWRVELDDAELTWVP